MSERRFTAQEMREYADAIAGDLNNNGMESVTYTFDELLPVIQSLRYAAGVVERCEKMRSDIMSRTYKHDIGWMGGDDKAVYSALGDVLRGDAWKEEI